MGIRTAAIVLAVTVITLTGCAKAGGSQTPAASSSTEQSRTVTQTFIVKNEGDVTLPQLCLKQDGGTAHNIVALAPGQSAKVPFQLSFELQDVILADAASGLKYGVQGPVDSDTPSMMYGDSMITLSSEGGRLTGWVSPINFPADTPGGAGYPLYNLSAK